MIVKKKKKNFIIDKMGPDGYFQLVYQPEYILKEYNYQSSKQNSDFKVTLDKSKLVASGKIHANELKKEYNISSSWIQDFNFGFYEFLNSKKREKKFIILNPNDLTLNDMIVIKDKIEKIKINSTTYNTQKVEVTLPGFRSMFWKAEIWYDLDTYDLIKYIANEGLGTPMTTILLESKK